MRICLVTIHARSAFIPLALLYLKAFLVEQRGHAFDDIEIVEAARDVDPEALARRIVAADPAVVGLSCYIWNITTLMEVARRIKTLRPSTKIVLGGPEVGPIAADVLTRHPAIDVVVRSEGEFPFADLVDRWRDGREIADVHGISRRRGDAVVDHEDATILQDLNQLSSPHRAEYATHAGRVVCIETQRGCVFQCSFCFYNKDFSIRNRRFDLDRVKREILFWLERDVQKIYLMDPVFNLNAARAKEICRFIIAHNRRRIPFHAEVWAEFIDEEMARLMSEANFQMLEVGLQTTDDTALSTVERRLRLGPFVEGIDHLKRHRLRFQVQLIYGLPGETPASFRKSLNFAASLGSPYLTVFLLMVLPGTQLWRKAETLALDFDPEPPYFIRSHPSMTEADIDDGRDIVEAVKLLGNSKALRMLAREPGTSFADLVDAWIAWQREHPEFDGRAAPGLAREFLAHVCAERRIPPHFYERVLSWELQA